MSNKTALQELQDARATVARLTAHNARAIGLETRLSTALQERDDLKQERDSATQRAKMAESRLLGLNQKYCEYIENPMAWFLLSCIEQLSYKCRTAVCAKI